MARSRSRTNKSAGTCDLAKASPEKGYARLSHQSSFLNVAAEDEENVVPRNRSRKCKAKVSRLAHRLGLVRARHSNGRLPRSVLGLGLTVLTHKNTCSWSSEGAVAM